MSAERTAVHEAIQGLLDEGEIAVAWTLQVDVVGPDSARHLTYYAGGGIDGNDRPLVWTCIGMIKSGLYVAEDQLRSYTQPDDEDDDAPPA